MSGSGTGGAQRRQDWRREQRRIARAHHPDLGADAEQYVQLMRELDLRFGVGPGTGTTDQARPSPRGPAPVMVRSRRGAKLRRGLRLSGQIVRAVRARMPHRMPGARRYIDL